MTLHSDDTVDSDQSGARRIALLSDVHGNLPAFQAVLKDVEATGVDAVWCLGDLVGYGAQPDECVALAQQACDACLVGNHDLAVLGKLDISDFSEGAATAARWTRAHIGGEATGYLEPLAPEAPEREVGLFHGSPRDPVWEYVLSAMQADDCMDEMRARVGAVGHSHVALWFHRADGGQTVGQQALAGTRVDISEGRWLLNPGGAGQPRDGDPRAPWLLLDLDDRFAEWRRVEYAVEDAARAIEAAGLPAYLGERLFVGQ
jgi:predicted phosphodiesterase